MEQPSPVVNVLSDASSNRGRITAGQAAFMLLPCLLLSRISRGIVITSTRAQRRTHITAHTRGFRPMRHTAPVAHIKNCRFGGFRAEERGEFPEPGSTDVRYYVER